LPEACKLWARVVSYLGKRPCVVGWIDRCALIAFLPWCCPNILAVLSRHGRDKTGRQLGNITEGCGPDKGENWLLAIAKYGLKIGQSYCDAHMVSENCKYNTIAGM
jgi:hypothetical protein